MYTPERIINKLREVEVFISQGATAREAGSEPPAPSDEVKPGDFETKRLTLSGLETYSV